MASFGGPIAQRLEQGTHNPLVAGSNPAGPKRDRSTLCDRVVQGTGRKAIRIGLNGVQSLDPGDRITRRCFEEPNGREMIGGRESANLQANSKFGQN